MWKLSEVKRPANLRLRLPTRVWHRATQRARVYVCLPNPPPCSWVSSTEFPCADLGNAPFEEEKTTHRLCQIWKNFDNLGPTGLPSAEASGDPAGPRLRKKKTKNGEDLSLLLYLELWALSFAKCSPGGFRAESKTVLGKAQAPRVEASQRFYCPGFIQSNKQTNKQMTLQAGNAITTNFHVKKTKMIWWEGLCKYWCIHDIDQYDILTVVDNR